ncbi:MAG: dual specificity protein phosphatase family protein [Candidatus Niyogibacteria bacterium]|nr:dual specificity protein phosphatase family protein [Candidatus Niyogibacteria bacterium]
MTTHKHTEYSRINRYIYIGTNFCCQIHFDKTLLNKGIATDISLEETRMDTPFGVKCYLWLPVKDHHAPTMYQFSMGVACIDRVVRNKEKVYVHCKNGHGRAPTLVAAYLLSQGMSIKAAIDFLTSRRAGVHLQQTQLNALKKFQRLYKI